MPLHPVIDTPGVEIELSRVAVTKQVTPETHAHQLRRVMIVNPATGIANLVREPGQPPLGHLLCQGVPRRVSTKTVERQDLSSLAVPPNAIGCKHNLRRHPFVTHRLLEQLQRPQP